MATVNHVILAPSLTQHELNLLHTAEDFFFKKKKASVVSSLPGNLVLYLVIDQSCFFVLFFVLCVCFFPFVSCSCPVEGIKAAEVTETYPVIDELLLPLSTKSSADPTMVFFSMDYGKFTKLKSTECVFLMDSLIGGIV